MIQRTAAFHLPDIPLRPVLLALFFPVITFLALPSLVLAQVPSAGQSGVIEKSLRKSRPQFEQPTAQEIPKITIQDSRQLKDAGAGPSFVVKRIEIEGNTLFDDETLAPLVDIKEGLEMTLGVVALYAQEVSSYYNSRGYILTRAYIPEQEIVNGIVKLQVVEGKLGKIHVRGTERLDSEDFKKRLERVRDEEILKEQTLERILIELNELLGVQVRSILKPGELPGTSDLVLEVTESRPYQIAFDADNFGSRFTGRNRFGLTATVGSLFKLGDQFSVRGVRSETGQNFIEPYYLLPINNHGTTLKGSFTFSEFRLGESLAALEAGGEAILYEIEIGQSLFRNRKMQFSVQGGVEFRTFKNERFAQTTSEDQLQDFYINFGGDITDPFLGRNFFNIRTQFGFSEGDPNRVLSSRAQGRGDGTIASANLVRFQGANFLNSYFFLKAEGQIVSDRVLSPDQLSIGGIGTVRGYPLAEFSGDNGYVASLEYVLPLPWKSPVGSGKLTLDQVLSFVAFVDHGKVFVVNKQPGEKDQAISGAGGGIRINVPKSKPNDLSANFSILYGVPVFGSPDPSDRSFGTIYVNGIITY